MNLSGIRGHLRDYSIAQRRTTTVNHAFASAIAPFDDFDAGRVERALKMLGQPIGSPVRCVYCGAEATTWDHLNPLVRGNRFSGFGHTLGNLVPSCSACNERKGNKDWRAWLQSENRPPDLMARLDAYIKAFAGRTANHDELAERFPNEMEQYESLRLRVLALMKEADSVAVKIRGLGKASAAAPKTQSGATD